MRRAEAKVGFAGRLNLKEWVAVVATSPEPRDLDEEVERLMALSPHEVLVERVGSHEGLAEALGVDPGGWCAGVVAGSRAELDDSIRRIRASPWFSAREVVVGRFRLVRLAG